MISVQNISKRFPAGGSAFARLRSALGKGADSETGFWALRNVDLDVHTGEFLSLIGPNGSGKSTLLQIVSGTLKPSAGRVIRDGRAAAILELGAGFNPEFTGRENAILSAGIMGLGKAEIQRALPGIEKFAEIGEFFDQPVKRYSSGMYVRLAFATAIFVQPEVLIVDEALAVGDAVFANRCVRKFEELRASGVTVLFVSHDLGLVKRLSDRAVFLHRGQIASSGSVSQVVNQYVGFVLENQDKVPTISAASGHGDGASQILEVELLDSEGRTITSVPNGTRLVTRIRALFNRDVDQPVFGILIRNRLGIDVFGTNTRVEGVQIGLVRAGEVIEIEIAFECRLSRQEYTLTVATQHWEGFSQDWRDDVLSFSVTNSRDIAGLTDLGAEVQWRKTK